MKRRQGSLLIGLILAVVATLLLIAIPSSANLYAAYVFCLLGIAALAAGAFFADEKDAVSTYAIHWQSAWLLPASVAVSAAVLLLQGVGVYTLPVVWHVVIQLALLAVFAIRVIGVYTGKEYVKNVGEKAASQVIKLGGLVADVNAAAGRVDTLPEDKRAAAKQALKKVSEALQYSDPMSSDAVQAMDAEIAQAVSDLAAMCTAERAGEIGGACDALCMKIRERNERLKFSKR